MYVFFFMIFCKSFIRNYFRYFQIFRFHEYSYTPNFPIGNFTISPKTSLRIPQKLSLDFSKKYNRNGNSPKIISEIF